MKNDLISRQAAIDALTEYGNGRTVYIGVEEAIRRIEQLPPAQPEKRTEERTETHGVCIDAISRQAAIDLIKNDAFWVQYTWGGRGHKPEMEMVDDLVESIIKQMKESVMSRLKQMPSAQPEQQWIPCSEPPEDEKNVFIAHGAKDFMTCCIGHYDCDNGLWYEDRNWFARPIFDGAFWCEIPLIPEAEG